MQFISYVILVTKVAQNIISICIVPPSCLNWKWGTTRYVFGK